MGKITNQVEVNKKFIKAASAEKYQKFYRSAALTRFSAAKQEMLESFDQDQVTRELLQDPSEAGSALLNKGNLVSFLGEEDASLKVGQIRETLRSETTLNEKATITYDKNKVYFDFGINYPTKKELNDAASSDWSNRSIIEMIEKGVGNAASYIFRSLGLPGSRSGFGLQSKKRISSGGVFSPRAWVTEIIADFRKKFL